MAVTLRLYSNANELARVTIPDTAIPKIQAAFPAATAALSAQAALEWIAPALKAYVLKTLKDKRASADQPTVTAGQAAEEAAMDTAWP